MIKYRHDQSSLLWPRRQYAKVVIFEGKLGSYVLGVGVEDHFQRLV
jgi:hypothetical protein